MSDIDNDNTEENQSSIPEVIGDPNSPDGEVEQTPYPDTELAPEMDDDEENDNE